MGKKDDFFYFSAYFAARAYGGRTIDKCSHFNHTILSYSNWSPNHRSFHDVVILPNINGARLGVEDCTCYLRTFLKKNIISGYDLVVGRDGLTGSAPGHTIIIIFDGCP